MHGDSNIVEFPDRSVIESEASDWIVRFERDVPPGPEDIAALQQWMARSALHREVLLRYASLWNDMDLLSELAAPAGVGVGWRVRAGDGISRWVGGFRRAVQALTRPLVGARRISWALASLLVVLSLVGMLLLESAPHRSGARTVYATARGERISDTLGDGSTLWLNTDSRVEIEFGKDVRRVLLLRGEAHFEVARDAGRPFEVHAGTRMVRAVGTAFSVYRKHRAVKVTVSEGKVELVAVEPAEAGPTGSPANESMRGGQPDSVTRPMSGGIGERGAHVLGALEAGQSAVLADDSEGVDGLVRYEQQELDRQLSWRRGLLVFAGEPLSEVVEQVGRYTALQIEISDPELRGLRIGGQFRLQETDALFDVLESAFGLRVSRVDDAHVKIQKVDHAALQTQ